MAAEAQSLRQTGGPPKRSIRNYLLDARFQLKYTMMVVGVAVVVASILGFLAYRYSTGMTQSLTASMAMQPDLDPEVARNLEGYAHDADMRVLFGIVGGILVLALILGVTGIIVTHKLVGPAYKLKRLFGEISDGHLRVVGKLRKGDELQDVFDAFERMVLALRKRQEEEIAHIDQVIDAARSSLPPEGAAASSEAATAAARPESAVLTELVGLRDRMRKELE